MPLRLDEDQEFFEHDVEDDGDDARAIDPVMLQAEKDDAMQRL